MVFHSVDDKVFMMSDNELIAKINRLSTRWCRLSCKKMKMNSIERQKYDRLYKKIMELENEFFKRSTRYVHTRLKRNA